MGKIILNVDENPPIKCFHLYAYPFSIMLTEPKGSLWLCNNFIQVVCSPSIGLTTYKWNEALFTKNVAFHIEQLDRVFLTKFNINIIEYIKFALEMKRWVYLVDVDEFYIPNRMAYQKVHNQHDLLIHGYDDDSNSFMVIGYDEAMHYRKTLAPYNDLFLADPKKIHLVGINETYTSGLNLDIPKIILQLKQYLNLVEQSQVDEGVFEDAVFGQEVFRRLAEYVNETVQKKEMCDVRHLLMFYEHKFCMLARMEYLQTVLTESIEDTIASYKEVVRLAETIRLCGIKYNITRDERMNGRMQKYFSDALELEKVCLLDLIEKLKI